MAHLDRQNGGIAAEPLSPEHTFFVGRNADPLVIGLVNNMPDAAFRNTEEQFRKLLSAASFPGGAVRLRLFILPGVPRSDANRAQLRRRYEDVGGLRDSHIDGLIVSGMEPRAPNLTDEPYWPSLVKLVEWAQDHTGSTIWSCLAAHAAVLYLDGIERQPYPQKLSGVFDCARVGDHAVVAGMPPRWSVPHSRHNGLAENALVAHGYRILSNSPDTGPDIFARQRRSLFLFLQGHPEYDAGALLREYRRDVGRFLGGKWEHYPAAPRGYFSAHATEMLSAFREQALRERGSELLASFPAISGGMITPRWRAPALAFYRNWLKHLLAQRLRRRRRAAALTLCQTKFGFSEAAD